MPTAAQLHRPTRVASVSVLMPTAPQLHRQTDEHDKPLVTGWAVTLHLQQLLDKLLALLTVLVMPPAKTHRQTDGEQLVRAIFEGPPRGPPSLWYKLLCVRM
jgi:hypothetical protein